MVTDVFNVSKAFDTSVATTGAVLIPEVVNPGIREFVEQRAPLYSMIDHVPSPTNTWIYREQTGLGEAEWGEELGALPPATHGTYGEQMAALKSIYTTIEISGQQIDSTATLLNVVQRELRNASTRLVRKVETTIVAGDSATNSTQFDGLAKQITTTFEGGGNPLNLAYIDALIDEPELSEPTHLIMSKAMSRKLWSLLQAQVRYVGESEVTAGFKVPFYGDKPIIRTFDAAHGLDTTIIAPYMDLVYMPVQREPTLEVTDSGRDSKAWFIRAYLTLVVEGAAQHHVKGVNVTSTIGA